MAAEEKSSTLVKEKLYKTVILLIAKGTVLKGFSGRPPEHGQHIGDGSSPAGRGGYETDHSPLLHQGVRELTALVFKHKRPIHQKTQTVHLRTATSI